MSLKETSQHQAEVTPSKITDGELRKCALQFVHHDEENVSNIENMFWNVLVQIATWHYNLRNKSDLHFLFEWSFIILMWLQRILVIIFASTDGLWCKKKIVCTDYTPRQKWESSENATVKMWGKLTSAQLCLRLFCLHLLVCVSMNTWYSIKIMAWEEKKKTAYTSYDQK